MTLQTHYNRVALVTFQCTFVTILLIVIDLLLQLSWVLGRKLYALTELKIFIRKIYLYIKNSVRVQLIARRNGLQLHNV